MNGREVGSIQYNCNFMQIQRVKGNSGCSDVALTVRSFLSVAVRRAVWR